MTDARLENVNILQNHVGLFKANSNLMDFQQFNKKSLKSEVEMIVYSHTFRSNIGVLGFISSTGGLTGTRPKAFTALKPQHRFILNRKCPEC